MPRSTRRDTADWFQPANKPRRRPSSVLTGGGASRGSAPNVTGSVAPSRAASSPSIAVPGAGGAQPGAPGGASVRPTRALSGALFAPSPAADASIWTAGRGRDFTDEDTKSVLVALRSLDAGADDGGAFPSEVWSDLVDTFLAGAHGTDKWLRQQLALAQSARDDVRRTRARALCGAARTHAPDARTRARSRGAAGALVQQRGTRQAGAQQQRQQVGAVRC